MAVEPKAGKRFVKVTDTRTKADFAYFISELVEVHFAHSGCIQLVLDNLNTHFESWLIETFGKRKANRFNEENKIHLYPKTCKLAKHG